MKLAAFAIGVCLGSLLTITEPVESAPEPPVAESVLVSALNGGMVVDGELWVCHPTGDKNER